VEVIKPDKAPLIQQETDVIVKPKHWDRVIELQLAKTALGRAPYRTAERTQELGRRTPPHTDTIQNGS
jgi:hypothetical protein